MMCKQLMGRVCLAAVVIGCLGAVVQAQDESYALMVQPSPRDAGMVSPAAGIHRIRMGQPVTVQAVPKPGYRFLYWLGDVSDSSTNQAVVVLDAPKIVVAVFGRMGHGIKKETAGGSREEVKVFSVDVPGGGAGGSTLTASSGYTAGGGSFGGGGGRYGGGTRYLQANPPTGGGGDDGFSTILVPGGDPGSQVPEPATLALLGIGALLFLRPRGR